MGVLVPPHHCGLAAIFSKFQAIDTLLLTQLAFSWVLRAGLRQGGCTWVWVNDTAIFRTSSSPKTAKMSQNGETPRLNESQCACAPGAAVHRWGALRVPRLPTPDPFPRLLGPPRRSYLSLPPPSRSSPPTRHTPPRRDLAAKPRLPAARPATPHRPATGLDRRAQSHHGAYLPRRGECTLVPSQPQKQL